MAVLWISLASGAGFVWLISGQNTEVFAAMCFIMARIEALAKQLGEE